MEELKAQIATLTARLEAAEQDLAQFREWTATREAHLSDRIDRLGSRLDDERRERENQDYYLERQVQSAESAARDAQRTADSAYSAAQHSGGRW